MDSRDTHRRSPSRRCTARPGAWAIAAACGLLAAFLLSSAIEALDDLAGAVHLQA